MNACIYVCVHAFRRIMAGAFELLNFIMLAMVLIIINILIVFIVNVCLTFLTS
jgi:hypothetical protein